LLAVILLASPILAERGSPAVFHVNFISPSQTAIRSIHWNGIQLTIDTGGRSPNPYVEIKIKSERPGDVGFWQGTGWGTDEHWLFARYDVALRCNEWNITPDQENIFLKDGYTYTIYVRIDEGYDDGYFWGTDDNFSFTVDNTAPGLISQTISSPTNCATSLIGGAQDMYTGVERIIARLWYREGSAYYYWKGEDPWSIGSGDAPDTSITVTSGSLPSNPADNVGWRFTFPTLPASRTYYYQFLARDRAGNVFGPINSFIYDKDPPTGLISSPALATGNYLSFTTGPLVVKINGTNWDKTIRGSASDTGGSGLNQVKLQVRRSGDNYYFNGSNWTTSTTPIPFTADLTLGGQFSYLLPDSFFVPAVENKTIAIMAIAYDSVGNSQLIDSHTLGIDNAPPTSAITTPAFYASFPTSIEGTCSDNFLVKSVKIRVARTRGGITTHWGQTGHEALHWTSSSKDLDATVIGSNWTYTTGNMFADAAYKDTYTVSSTAYDYAGNMQSPTATQTLRHSTGAFLDITYPRTAFNSTSKPNHLSVVATDEAGIKILIVAAAHDLRAWIWDAGPWSDPPAVPAMLKGIKSLYIGDNTYQVPILSNFYDEITDGTTINFAVAASNEVGVITTITRPVIYDNTPPTNPVPSPTYPERKWFNSTNAVLVRDDDFIRANDPIPPGKAASGILGYLTRLDFGGSPIWYDSISSADPEEITFDLSRGEGIYTFNIQTVDNALNAATSPQTFQVGYDITAPNLFNIIYPADRSTIDITTPVIRWNAASDGGGSGIEEYEIYLEGDRLIGTTHDTSFNLPPDCRLNNGRHLIVVSAIDKAGNFTWSQSTFTVQTHIAPVVEIRAPAMVNTPIVDIHITASDDCLVNTIGYSINSGIPIPIPITPAQSVDFTHPIDLKLNMINNIVVQATDDTALPGEASISVICDTIPPSSFGLISPANDSWTSPQPSFKWEPSSDYLSGLAGYDLYIDFGKVNTELITGCAYALTSTLSDVEHTYYVVARDNAGNSRTSDVFTFKVDSVAPSAFTLTAPAEGQYFESAFDVSWTRSADENSGLAAYDIYIDGEKKADAAADATTITITDVPSDGTHNLYVEARDVAGNTTRSNAVNITTNPNAPTITLLVNDKSITSGSKLNSLPNIKAQIIDNSGIDPTSIKIKIDGQVQGAAADLQAAQVRAAAVTAYDARKNDVRLKSGKHSIRVEAKDVFGKEAVLEVTDLDVLGKAVIDGKPMNFPNPFKPSLGETTSINYILLDDADIKISLYDLSARLVIVKICNAGTEGGRFGENNVIWDGKSLYGDIQANGVYVYLIATTKGEVIGTGEISIYE